MYDKKGRIIKEKGRRVFGGFFSSTNYKYLLKNLMISKIHSKYNKTDQLLLKYNLQDRIEEETHITPDEKSTNYIFYEKNNFISSRVYKDPDYNLIYIVRYQFKYHSDDLYIPFMYEPKPYDFSDTVATKSFR